MKWCRQIPAGVGRSVAPGLKRKQAPHAHGGAGVRRGAALPSHRNDARSIYGLATARQSLNPRATALRVSGVK